MYIHFVFGVSIIGAVFLGRFCPYTVSEKESWGEVVLLNFICLCYVIFFFYISFEKGSSSRWQKECNEAGRNTPDNIVPLSAIIKPYFKLQLFTKSLPRNSEIQWPGEINLFADNDKKQTDVESMY